MPASGLAGILGTSKIGSGQQLKIDMDPKIHMIKKNDILTVISKLGTGTVHNWEFKGEESPYFEIDDPVRASSSAGSAGAAVEINISDATVFHLDYVVIVKGINCTITAIDPTTDSETITVKPINASQAVPALTTANVITVKAASKPEGYDLGASRISQRRARINYIEEISTVFSLTNTMMRVDQYGNMTRAAEESMKHWDLLRKMIHSSLIYGEKAIDSSTHTFPQRFTGGIKGEVSTNAHSFTAAQITDADLLNISKTAFQHGNEKKRKLLFGTRDFTAQMNTLHASKYTEMPRQETVMGVKFNKYENDFGEFLYTTDDILRRENAGFDAFYIDPQYIKLNFLKNSKPRISYNVVKDGSDKQTNTIDCKFGFDVGYEEAHGKLIGA